jgi:hypothetical protein
LPVEGVGEVAGEGGEQDRETKFAVRMREEGRRRETIVIDREVCGRGPTDQRLPFTCDKQLRHFLPPGAELTVVEYDGTRRTYRGDPG